MKIIVDADASPVKNEIIRVAANYNVSVILVMSIAHYSFQELPPHVQTVYVEKGVDQADFKIIQLAQAGDIIVTQDYGLASLLLPKDCQVIHHRGYEYTDQNINQLLEQRHFSALERNAGLRTKGPREFTAADREKFVGYFDKILQNFTHSSK